MDRAPRRAVTCNQLASAEVGDGAADELADDAAGQCAPSAAAEHVRNLADYDDDLAP